MNRNVGKAQISQKRLKGQKKGAMEKTLIRIITRANPSLPHDSHHRSEYNTVTGFPREPFTVKL